MYLLDLALASYEDFLPSEEKGWSKRERVQFKQTKCYD